MVHQSLAISARACSSWYAWPDAIVSALLESAFPTPGLLQRGDEDMLVLYVTGMPAAGGEARDSVQSAVVLSPVPADAAGFVSAVRPACCSWIPTGAGRVTPAYRSAIPFHLTMRFEITTKALAKCMAD